MGYARRFAACAVVVAAFLVTAPAAFATPFDFIRIGDLDGFGFTPTAGLVRATGVPHTTPADTNGNGVLEQTEFLPDLNLNGAVATGAGDDFDNRSAAEKLNVGISGNGFTDTGSSGAKWTDIALSTSSTFVPFPDPGGPGIPNQPSFIYMFHVAGADVTGADLFFNVLFGDYDVVPADITLTFASAATRTLALTPNRVPRTGLSRPHSQTWLLVRSLRPTDPEAGTVFCEWISSRPTSRIPRSTSPNSALRRFPPSPSPSRHPSCCSAAVWA